MTALKVESPLTFPEVEEEEPREVETSQDVKRPKKRFADRLRLFWRAWWISFFGSIVMGIVLGAIDADMRHLEEIEEGWHRSLPRKIFEGLWWRIFCFAKGWFMIFFYFHYMALKGRAELLDSAESTKGNPWELFVSCPFIFPPEEEEK